MFGNGDSDPGGKTKKASYSSMDQTEVTAAGWERKYQEKSGEQGVVLGPEWGQ